MKILKADGQIKACFTVHELLKILTADFFKKLTVKLQSEPTTLEELSNYVKILADKSVDSKEYEYYTAILDLYEQFEKNCSFCFNLKDTYNLNVDSIMTFQDLEKYREDPPDVIVQYKNQYADFELKRYRGEVTAIDIFEFIKKKILQHYAGKSNYLIIMQPKPNSLIIQDEFKVLHELIMKEKNIPGVIGISLNHDNKEMLHIQITPKLMVTKRKFNTEVNQYADILHNE